MGRTLPCAGAACRCRHHQCNCDPDLGADRGVADTTCHAPGRRDSCDDALSRYRCQRRAKRRRASLPRADDGESRGTSGDWCDTRLRDRDDRLRLPCGTDVAPRYEPGSHGKPGSVDAVARRSAHHQLRFAPQTPGVQPHGRGMMRAQPTGRMAMSYRIVFWSAVGWVALCLAPYVYALNDLITWR